MGIMKRRNAVLGWAVWKVGKRVVKRKAKAVVPGSASGAGGARTKALAGGLAALGGALLFWRRKKGGDETP